MADVTVSGSVQIQALPAATTLDGTELLHVKQGTADKRTTIAEALALHGDLTNNPHSVTKDQVSLGNVANALQLTVANNLSDVADVATSRTNLGVYSSTETDTLFVKKTVTINGHELSDDVTVTKSDVGLGNVPNWTYTDLYTDTGSRFASATALNALYQAIQNESPVGTVLHTFSSANPGTYKLCGGTWELISKGRTLVGYDDSDSTRPVGTEFGSSSITLVTANLPPHKHSVTLTGGDHTHLVTGTVDAGGAHSHSFSGTTSTFDYGTKSGTTSSSGNHAHSGNTDQGGNHWHPQGTGTSSFNYATAHTVKNWTGSDETHSWNSSTDWAGVHTHSFTTNSAGSHTHTMSISIGSHNHSYSGTTSTASTHTHPVNITSQSATHTHTGNTDNTGSGTAISVEQKSLVCYIWRRTA